MMTGHVIRRPIGQSVLEDNRRRLQQGARIGAVRLRRRDEIRILWIERAVDDDRRLGPVLISPAAAAVEWEISPSNPVVEDTLKITGTAAPGESVRAEVTYEKILPVSGGKYQLSLKNIKIPEGSDNLFSVRAEGVQNLHVGVKKLVSFNLNAAATNGVATISQGHVPSWTYDILIDGNALKGQKSVVLKIKASQTLKADSKGNLAFNYETSSMPAGEFKIKIGNSEKTIELRDKWQKKPVADFTAALVSGKMQLQVKYTDKSTASPKAWNWNFGDRKLQPSKIRHMHTLKAGDTQSA